MTVRLWLDLAAAGVGVHWVGLGRKDGTPYRGVFRPYFPALICLGRLALFRPCFALPALFQQRVEVSIFGDQTWD
jgi:hypothetical protein